VNCLLGYQLGPFGALMCLLPRLASATWDDHNPDATAAGSKSRLCEFPKGAH